jgi:hypothetical protein
MQRASSPRSRWWLAIVQVILLLVTMVAPAAAATTPSAMTGTQLIQLLQSYGIVKGDDQGNLNLDKPITRAEMITILVRSVGGESEAELYKGFNMYSDAKGHWAEGYLNYATVKRLIQGDGNGTVRPQDPVSYAEALTMLVRLVGKEPTTGEWPNNVFLVAIDLKLVPEGVTAGTIRQPAVRGLIFQSLAKGITLPILPGGKTALSTYVDTTPPTVTAGEPAATKEAKVRINGTHRDAVTIVVSNQEATISGSTWYADVDLAVGENSISVVAADAAGNTATVSVKATRLAPIAKLEITGPAQVRKGGTATYQVKAYDSANQAVSLAGVTAKVEGNIGAFNLQTGTLTASSTEAKGKIIIQAGTASASVDVSVYGVNPNATGLRIRPINDGRPVSYTQEMTVTVDVIDRNGNVLTDDYGRSITLTAAGVSGLTVTPTNSDSVAGSATFRIRSTIPGTITMMANAGGLQTATATSIFSTNTRIQLVAEPNALTAGSSNTVSRIKATLVNESGQAVPNNTGSDIRVTLSLSGSDGVLADREMTIYRGLTGSTASGDDAFFNAGTTTTSISITGVVTTGQNITVEPVSVSVTAPQLGSASKWEMIYPVGTLAPNGLPSDNPYYFSIRMADASGNTIPANFGFQLEISTSNNETKTNGLPDGVQIFLSPSGLNPVSDAVTEGQFGDGNDVIVRTNGGMATFGIKYNKVGQVKVKVLGMPATGVAYNPDGTVGSAVSGNVVANQEFTLNFTTTATNVKLEVDSQLGNSQPVGAVAAGTSQSFKVRALFTNNSGSWIPGATGTVTLQKVSGTATVEPSLRTINVVDGKAEFSVTGTGLGGQDVYKVVDAKYANGTSLPISESNTVILIVQSAAPGAPTILAARGMSGNVPGAWYYVSPTDDSLEFDIAPSSTGYAVVSFYQQNYATPFFTSNPVEMTGAPIRVRIPKSALPVGKMQYQVTFKNAYTETNPRILTPDFVTNASLSSSITISSAKYDRVAGKLYLYGSGFGTNTGTSPDTVNTTLLSVRDTSLTTTNPGIASVGLTGAIVESIYYNTITLNVAALAPALNQLSGSDVTVSAERGWYTKYNGEIANTDSGDPVGPMAKVEYATYDRSNSRLILTGAGFNTGTLAATALKLVKGSTEYSLASATNYRVSDSEWVLYLSNLTNVVTALNTDAGFTMVGADSWFYDSSNTQIRQTAFAPVSVYDRANVSSVSYDPANDKLKIYGNGFTGWTVDVSKVHIVNLGATPVDTRNITGSVVVAESTDSLIVVLLTDPNPLEGTGHLSGSSLYVTAEAGWLTKTEGAVTRQAAPIPIYMLLLPPQP